MKITITRSLACTGMTGPGQQRQADLLMSRLVTAYWPDISIEIVEGGDIGDDPAVEVTGFSDEINSKYSITMQNMYINTLDAVFDRDTNEIELLINTHTMARNDHDFGLFGALA